MLPLVFGFFFLCSFIGWGALFRWLSGDGKSGGFALESILGVSALLFMGGWLNMAALISRAVNISLIACGLFFFVYFRRQRLSAGFRAMAIECLSWRSRKLRYFLPFLLAMPLLFFALLAALHSIRDWEIIATDDYYAYFAFPLKMLANGTMGADPFSVRRYTALGGNSFLQSIVLSFVPLRDIGLIEPALAMLIVLLVARSISRRTAATGFQLPTILAFIVPIFAFYPVSNSTNLILGMIGLVVFFDLCHEGVLRGFSRPRILQVALIGAAIAALKGSLYVMPPLSLAAALGCRFFSSWRAGRSVRGDVPAALGAGVALLAFMFPWLVAGHETMGTWLYPLFGEGYYVTSYHDVEGLLRPRRDYRSIVTAIGNTVRFPLELAAFFFLAGWAFARERLWVRLAYLTAGLGAYMLAVKGFTKEFVVLQMLAVFWVIYRQRWRISLSVIVVFAQLGVVSIVGFALFTHVVGYSFQRYFYALPCALLLYTLLRGLPELRKSGASLGYRVGVGTLAFALAFYETSLTGVPSNLLAEPGLMITALQKRGPLSWLKPALPDPAPMDESGRSWDYANLQAAIPQGKVVLARLDRPYRMNFQTHKIWIIDIPIEVSLPPGIPYRKGPAAVEEYFVNSGICYLAMSRRVFDWSKKSIGHAADDFADGQDHFSPWPRAQSRMTLDFEKNIMALAEVREHVFDDGRDFVLKLCSK